MFKGKIRSLLKLGLLFSLLIASCILLAHSLIQRPSVQKYLLERLSGALGYEITADEVNLSLWGRIGIQASDFKASSDMGPVNVSISSVTVFLDALQLIKGRLIPTGVELDKPKIELNLDNAKKSVIGTSEVLSADLFKSLAAFPSLSVREATLSIKDFPYSIGGLSFEVYKRSGSDEGYRLLIVFNGRVLSSSREASIKGKCSLVLDREKDPAGSLVVDIQDAPLEWIPFPDDIVVNGGMALAHLEFEGNLNGRIQNQGSFVLKNTVFDLVNSKRSKKYDLPEIVVAYRASYSGGIIEISSFGFETPEFILDVESSIDIRNISNPRLDLKVTSPLLPTDIFKQIIPTPLLPVWLEDRLLKGIKEGHVKVEHFTLNGTIEDIENLDIPKSKGVLSTRVLWEDLDVFMAGGSLPVNNVKGKLVVENGRLLVSDVMGTFGLSKIKEASLEIKDLYADVNSYLISINGEFLLQDLMHQRGIPLIPRDVRRVLGKIEPVNGKMRGSIGIVYHDDWDYPRLASADVTFENFTITQEILIFPLTLDELHLHAGKGKKNMFLANGTWGNTEFTSTGSSDQGWRHGEAKVKVLADLAQLNMFYKGEKPKYSSNGPVACNFSLNWSDRLVSCLADIDLSQVNMETPSLFIEPSENQRRMVFDAELGNLKEINIKNGAFYLGNSILNFSAVYDKGKNRLKDLSFDTSGISLEDLGIRFKDAETRAKGTIIGYGTIKDFSTESKEISIRGMLRGKELAFTTPGLAAPVLLKN